MKIRFDSNQPYQRDAMDAVLGLFDGQPLSSGAFEFALSDVGSLAGLTELGLGNRLALDEAALLRNLQTVQQANKLPASAALDGMNFSVEMETGTGKTYVYLRSIFELHQRYGFSKFIIVVPSVAIREGVITSLRLMKEHFQALFGNVAFDSWVYDSKQYSKLRQFAQSSMLQILVMNIDAFNKKDVAVIHQEKDQLSGRRPIEFVQAAQPIVVMDEPQNMETPTAREAIASLNPLCTLRYSATHRNPYNLVYKLDPVQAYDLKLVKRIEVSSVLDDPDFNQPYILVQSISATKTKVTARLMIDVNEKGCGSDGDPGRRIIDPCQVVSAGRAWYVHAWCETSGGWRLFRVERFLEIKPLAEGFEPREPDRALERPEELFRAPATVPARVVFGAGIARWLHERYPGGRALPDGRYEVTFQVADPSWFVREILQYGAEAEVVEPGSLREAVREMVSARKA